MATILHLIPTLEGGGAERQMMMLAREQVRRGWTVHVASRRGGVHGNELRKAGVVTHALHDLKGMNPSLLASIRALVRHIEPQVVQTWLPQMDIVGGIVALWSSVPWVLSERSSRQAYTSPFMAMSVRRYLGTQAGAIIANSVEGARYWKGKRNRGNVAVVGNAVSISDIQNATPQFYENARNSESVLLAVGRLVREKAPDILVEAVNQIDQAHSLRVVFIGEGPLREELSALVKRCSLEKRVDVISYRANWWGLLKTCTGLINASRFEGQPNVVLEAMAAGCPLIVSDIPEHRAILDNESAVMVPPENATALADAIVSLLTHSAAARQRACRAYERVAGSTISSVADQYERVYASILNGTMN
jgi:glycosyltransferase involved in cell wall biosynthesis